MSSKRDPFADFARMSREMDELLGDFWGQAAHRPAARAVTAFAPRVDVYYCEDISGASSASRPGAAPPEKAIVKVDLPGVDIEAINLEVRGRRLVITGERPVRETEGRTYQQVELPSGPFRRVVELQTDVVADEAQASYEDGILRVELPVRLPESARQVPIERAPESQ